MSDRKIIGFTNKRCKDAISMSDDQGFQPTRHVSEVIPAEMKSKSNETHALQLIFTECNHDKEWMLDGIKLIQKEIDVKRRGYLAQDKKKGIVGDELITKDEIVAKLLASKLKCSYCREDVVILFCEVRQKNQWTLDRIDNDLGHTNDNTVICCLKCNLSRRRQGYNRFKLSKCRFVKQSD